MKYNTGPILLICACILIFGCTGKKDIISDQGPESVTKEAPAESSSTAPSTDSEVGGNTITDIKISEGQNGDSLVVINSLKKLNYTVFKMPNPDRVIVDVPDATSKAMAELAPDTALVSRVRSSALSDKDTKYVRIEIYLKGNAAYTTRGLDDSIQIDISSKSADSRPAITQAPAASAGTAALVKASNKSVGTGNLVQFQLKNATSKYRSYKLSNPSRIVIEFDNTVNKLSAPITINENLIEKIRFGLTQQGIKAVIDVQGQQPPAYKIAQSGDVLAVAVGTEAFSELPKPGAPEQAAASEPAAEEPKKSTAGVQKTEKAAAAGDKNFTGEKISLDFKDADLKNVLRLLGEISGINMTIGDKVGGKVTLRLDNVPSDEALDIVLINNGLDKTVTPQYTRIDTIDQIKKFNDDRAQAKRSYEQAEDTVLKTFSISYAQASNLASFIQKMNVLTPNRGSVNFFDLTNKLTVSDIPSVIAKVEKIILEQDIPTRQVMIESRVVQSAPGWVKDLGIAWGGTYGGHGNNAQIPIKGAAGSNNEIVNLLGAANGAINIGYITDKYKLDATLTAYESQDKLKILSNPRVLTLDNKESTIKQGVQLPYLKLNDNGVTSTEFKDAVLEMKVKPKITAANTISIMVDVKKDQKSAQTGTGNEPGIDVRQIKTELLVESGKTVVIGGIYENTKSKNIKKVPFFADIPFIGVFFKSVREDETLTEMLVFITVTVVDSPNTNIISSNENK